MQKVKLSVNAPLDNLEVVERAGFDCIEPSNTDIAKMTPMRFQEHVWRLQDSPVDCKVIDNPIPCAVSFSSPEWDIQKWMDYLKLSAYRCAALGAEYWCFGNGGSRRLPEDEDGKVRTMVNMYAAVSASADIAKEYGVKVIVEPLGPSVTNYLCNLPETIAFVKELNRSNVFTMVDYRWEYEQNRPASDLYRYADMIVHAHIDNPGTDYLTQKIRKVQRLDDSFDYTPFLNFIKSDSFHGVVSIEANCFDDYERDLTQAIEFYKAHGIEPFRKS